MMRSVEMRITFLGVTICLLHDKMSEETLTLKEWPEPNLETRISFTLMVGYFHWACKQPHKTLRQLHSNMGYSHSEYLSNHPSHHSAVAKFCMRKHLSHHISTEKCQVSSLFSEKEIVRTGNWFAEIVSAVYWWPLLLLN